MVEVEVWIGVERERWAVDGSLVVVDADSLSWADNDHRDTGGVGHERRLLGMFHEVFAHPAVEMTSEDVDEGEVASFGVFQKRRELDGVPLLSKMEAALAAESCSEVGRASSWLEAVEVEVCVADMFAEAAKSMITAGVSCSRE